jgi:hypothetical protein
MPAAPYVSRTPSTETNANEIIGPSTGTYVRCKMTKIPLGLYEKDLAIWLVFYVRRF